MALNYQGVLGNWSGKVGNVVGRVRRGRTVIAVYQPAVNQPNTEGQLAARQRLSLISSFLRAIDGWLRYGFPTSAQSGANTYWSAAVGANLRANPFSGTYPSVSIDFVKSVLSVGRLEMVAAPSASLEAGSVSVAWTDNSNLGFASEEDTIAIIAYNPAKKQCVYNSAAARRTARTASLALPSAWSGDTVEVWIAVRSEKGDVVSNSAHLGSFSL